MSKKLKPILIGLKRFYKPNSIDSETWQRIINHIDELIDKDVDEELDIDMEKYVKGMIECAIEEVKNDVDWWKDKKL